MESYQVLFNSFGFVFVFLPVVSIGFALLAHWRRDLLLPWLVAASGVFYAQWSTAYLGMLVLLTLANYALGAAIMARRSLALTILAVALNLGVLGFFKYANFLIANVEALFGRRLGFVEVALPLGISFFIFQKIASLVDCYRGRIRNLSFRHFILFVLFFPQLIAGPIVHYQTLAAQFRRWPALLRVENYAAGLALFAIGLFKKTVIADPLAPGIIAIQQSVLLGAEPTFFSAWIGTLLFAFRIYFDFSAYSDMALGLARIFGIRLPVNFWSPYKATSVIDFWRRWHITLSRFLRDYLYIPLGGNRRGRARHYLNLLITMLLGGLWHGAAWTFVAWGGLHGIYLAVNHLWRGSGAAPRLAWVPQPLRRIAARAVTFIAVTFAWAFFHAPTFDAALAYIRGMVGMNGIVLPPRAVAALGPLGDVLGAAGLKSGAVAGMDPATVSLLLAVAAVAWFCPNSVQIMRHSHPAWRAAWERPMSRPPQGALVGRAALAGAAGALAILFISRQVPFIYFNF